jgi:hypothetical protein
MEAAKAQNWAVEPHEKKNYYYYYYYWGDVVVMNQRNVECS